MALHSIKRRKELLAHFTQAISDIYTGRKLPKTYIFTARCKNFTTVQEIKSDVVDGLFQAEEVGNKHFTALLLETLVKDQKSFFELFCKQA